jgi:hypothetical protein
MFWRSAKKFGLIVSTGTAGWRLASIRGLKRSRREIEGQIAITGNDDRGGVERMQPLLEGIDVDRVS